MATVQDFAPLVAGSHTARFRATLVDGFQTGEDPSGDDLTVIDGGIEFDATADIRASGDLTVSGPWPRAGNLDLGPYGTEVFLARGVETGANQTLWAELGYYRISATEQGDAAKGPLGLALDDRMATIIDSRLLSPRQWPQGSIVGDIVDELVLEVYPDAVIVWDDDANLSTLGRQLISEDSRYKVLRDLANGLGKIMFWDSLGRLVFQTAPDEDTPDWTVAAGPRGAMVEADRELSRDGVYNAVVVNGEGLDDQRPVRAVAFDAQPSSPTFFGGPFGRIPRFYSSPFITTPQQAQNAAEQILRRSLGAPYDVGLEAIPNPALRPYDVLRVVYDDGNRELHTVETVEITLNVDDPISVGTRESTVVFVSVSRQ